MSEELDLTQRHAWNLACALCLSFSSRSMKKTGSVCIICGMEWLLVIEGVTPAPCNRTSVAHPAP